MNRSWERRALLGSDWLQEALPSDARRSGSWSQCAPHLASGLSMNLPLGAPVSKPARNGVCEHAGSETGAPSEFMDPMRVLSKRKLPMSRATLSLTRTESGAVLFQLSADPDRTYRIQGSADLSQWIDLTNVTGKNVSFPLQAIAPTNAAYRFFRSVSP